MTENFNRATRKLHTPFLTVVYELYAYDACAEYTKKTVANSNHPSYNACCIIFIKLWCSQRSLWKMNNYKWNRNKSTIETSGQPKLIKERRQRVRRSMRKHRETEEEAIIRRYHDAQRMARFRARRKNALENAKILKAEHITELCAGAAELERKNVTLESAKFLTPIPDIQLDAHFFVQNSSILVQPICSQSKYAQLLAIIEELGKDIKLTYTGSKISAERLRFGIIRARMLIKEYLIEIEMNLQQ